VGGAEPKAKCEVHVDFEEADFLAVFPLTGTGCLRLIVPVGWEPNREHRDLTFDDVGERAIRNLRLTIAKVNCRKVRTACWMTTGKRRCPWENR